MPPSTKSPEAIHPWITAALLEEEHRIYYDPHLPIQSPSTPLSPSSPHKSAFNPSPIIPPTSFFQAKPEDRRLTMSLHSDDESEDTAPTALSIAPLQDIESVEGKRGYNPINIDDPRSFDLIEPSIGQEQTYSLEKRAELLFSKAHLEAIFADARPFLKFTTFLSKHRPHSVPLLIYYLDSVKALKAIAYSNAIVDGLEALSLADFTATPPKISFNASLQEKSDRAFAILTQQDLPAYITHVFVEIVSTSIHRKITGTMAPQLVQASEGLAEVFCMSDLSKPDNPIVFSSEEFHRTTQYGLNYAIGRNCRFLQGPRTSPFSVKRLREAVHNGREHQETFLNYRRDGSPFMNLLTMAPLLDNQGTVRYFIGAQVDVSGLVKDCTSLEAFARLVDEQETQSEHEPQLKSTKDKKDEFQSLSEMFNQSELETVRLHGGRMHSEQHDLDDSVSIRASNRPRLLIRDPAGEDDYETGRQGTPSHDSPSSIPSVSSVGRLPGVFTHYLILRPHPSLRITFTSPSLRVPGLLQSPFISRIGGSARVREELALALSEGRNVTARIRWLNARIDSSTNNNTDDYPPQPQPHAGKARWIHCTPLLGPNRAVGAWMVIMIDGEDYEQTKKNQVERIGVVSPTWGRQSRSNSTLGLKTRGSAGRQGQYLRDTPPATAMSREASEWDFDLDVASATFAQQPGNATDGLPSQTPKLKSKSSALAPAPPSKAVPPPPVPGYTMIHNVPGAKEPSRPIGGRLQGKSSTGVLLPLSSHSTFQARNTSLNSPIDGTLSGALQAGFSNKIPHGSSPTPNSPRAVAHPSTPTSSSAATSYPASQQPQQYQRQQQQYQNSQQRVSAKPSTETLGKKSITGFGHRMFHGLRRSTERADKEREMGQEHTRQSVDSRHG